MTYTFSVPRVPPSPNQMRRELRHFRNYAKMRDYWGWLIKLALQPSLPHIHGRCKVHIHVEHKQAFDPDNLYASCKIPLDAMVNIGLLAGDSEKHIELKATQEANCNKLTRITLEELSHA